MLQLLTIILCSPVAFGDSPSLRMPHVGVQYGLGVAGFTGTLSDDHPLVHEWQLKTLFVQSPAGRWRGYLGVHVQRFQTYTHDYTAFPFPKDADLHSLNFLFIGHACYRPAPVQLCLGLGEGTVNVNAPNDRRDFGTWNYHGQVDLELPASFSTYVAGRFVGQVEQLVDGVPSEFSYWTAAAGVGFAPARHEDDRRRSR